MFNLILTILNLISKNLLTTLFLWTKKMQNIVYSPSCKEHLKPPSILTYVLLLLSIHNFVKSHHI